MKFYIVNFSYEEIILDNEGNWSEAEESGWDGPVNYKALLNYNYEIKKISDWEARAYITVNSLEDLLKLRKELNCDLIIREETKEGITILQLYDGYIE